MNPELNREYPELDDPATFAEMVALIADRKKPACGHVLRSQHAKATGCVRAEFRIADDVPTDLQHGIFSRLGHTFSAIVRFSNSPEDLAKDGGDAARGMAIKLTHAAATAAEDAHGGATQDFLMVNNPRFLFGDPKSYVEFMKRKAIGEDISPVIGKVIAGVHLVLLEHEAFEVVQEIRHAHVASPLEITYWSGTPYWLGVPDGKSGHAVKYTAVSRQAGRTPVPEHPAREPDDYLTRALASGLKHDAIFDFKIQLQTDAQKMPVENPAVAWDEHDSPPLTVATLRIPAQDVDPSSDLARECESMSFNPWHALPEHRPLGGMNRLRKVVYEASTARRTGGNRCPAAASGPP
jgi:hypothetical protein